MDNLAFSPHAWSLGADGAHQIHAQLGRGVAAPWRHHGVNGTAQSRVQQRGIPAAVDGAHGIEVGGAWCALKNGTARFNLHDQKIQRFGNRSVGNVATQHGLHDFQTRQAGDLFWSGHARSWASVQSGVYGLLLCQPAVKQVCCAHGFLSVRFNRL
jgi:hypothetical protein